MSENPRWYVDIEQYRRYAAASVVWGKHCRVIPLADSEHEIRPTEKYGGDRWRDERFDPALHPELLERILFGLYMGSTRLVCLDIDAHHGDDKGNGFTTLDRWRAIDPGITLPPTLATVSRHGNGRHLFYRADDRLKREGRDVIGLNAGEPDPTGLDLIVRGMVTFCTMTVASLVETRSNGLPVADCPDWLDWLAWRNINARTMAKPAPRPAHSATRRRGCPKACSQPIEKGRRNCDLYRWGCGISLSYEDWPDHVRHRGEVSGLPEREIQGIIRSIQRSR